MTRTELQDEAVEILELHRKLICMWGTGVGKSWVVTKFLRKHPGFRTLILVPEQNNIKNWQDEFEKSGTLTLGVDIMCYASMHKQKNTNWDLLVVDEAAHVDTEKRKEIFKSISAHYVLALGALIDDDQKKVLEDTYGKFQVSKYGLNNAIQSGILPTPTIYVMHMELDNKDRKYKHKSSLLTAKGYYDILRDKVTSAYIRYGKKATEVNKNAMLQAGLERKRFLGELKENAVKKICKSLEDANKRYLCFCSSIEQAKSLSPENSFTSLTPTSKKMLDRFNNKEINSLYVVGKLIEGQNLKDIDCGVITQLGGTARITIQECGRIMRSKNPEIFVLVFDGTKDDSYLYTLTSSISKEYIKHYKY